MNRGRCLALFLCAVFTGCGFRSGFDTDTLVLDAFVLDAESRLQGQAGLATAAVRNAGPRVVQLPALHIGVFGESADVAFAPPEIPDEIAPGDTILVKWTFVPAENAAPGTRSLYAKLGEGASAQELTQPLSILQAATLEASLEFAGKVPADFTCREKRSTSLDATVTNVGASPAVVSLPTLLVSREGNDVQALFEVAGADTNPEEIAAGATVVFHLQLLAIGQAPPAEDYGLVFGATVVDATTGHARPAPKPLHEPLPLRVHVPATLELLVQESATTLSTAAPNAGSVQIQIHNAGTVAARIDDAGLEMRIVDTTTTEYAIAAAAVAFPFTVAAGADATITYATVELTSATPALGTTVTRGAIAGFDVTCDEPVDALSAVGDSGSWVVE